VANSRRARLGFHPIFQRQHCDLGLYNPTEEQERLLLFSTSHLQPKPPPAPLPQLQELKSRVRDQGNISSSCERIYHVPGRRYYDKTQMNEGKGERWFCSEQEAVGAGWRKAKV
jgi:hypothetical protein